MMKHGVVAMALILAMGLAGAARGQDSVGVTAAVNPDATGTPPQRATRTLNIGLDMFRNERITTGPVGKTQLLFLDGSALSIGPNSEVVLDEFVYDPSNGTGKLAMTATKGVFRLVGGRISKTEPVTLTTPTATIGIRGGIGSAEIGTGNDFAGIQFGKMTVTPKADQPAIDLVRPGTGVQLFGDGRISGSMPFPVDQLNRMLAALEGDRGRGGGASEQPTEGRVRQAGVSNNGSANNPSDLREDENAAADIASVASDAEAATNLSQASQTGFAPSPRGSSSTDVNSAVLLGRYKSTPGSGTALGAGDTSLSFNRPLFAFLFGGNFVGFTPFSSSSSGFSLSSPDYKAPITGTLLETTERGSFFSFSSGNTTSPFGPISGKVFVSANGDFYYYENIEENFSNERSLAFAGIATPLSVIAGQASGSLLTYKVGPDGIFGSNLAFILQAAGGNLAGTRSNAYILNSSGSAGSQSAFLQGNLAIDGQGTSQRSAVSLLTGRVVRSPAGNVLLEGFARGSFRTGATANAGFLSGAAGFSSDALGNGVFGATNPDFFVLESSDTLGVTSIGGFPTATALPTATGITQSLNGVNTTYFPNDLAQRIANPGGVGVSRQSRSLGGFATGFVDFFNAAGTLISNNIGFQSSGSSFALSTDAGLNTISGMINGSAGTANFVLPIGGGSGDGRSAFVDDKLIAAVEAPSGQTRNGSPVTAVKMYVVGNELVSTSNFLPSGVSYCACTASSWGYFGFDVLHANGTDRLHLGQFVAGNIPASVPVSGSGSYIGHAVGDIAVNGGARFKAAGNLSFTYNFSTATGTWSVTNFDGGSVSGSIGSGTPGSPTYGLTFIGTTTSLGGVSGSFSGAFFSNGSDTAAETGGRFSGSGTGGSLNGIFQGKR